MSSERRYTETEAVEIIQRALNSFESDSETNGLTQNDLWRIAEEAGATRPQFDSALATTVSKVSTAPPKGSMGTSNYYCVIAGELTPDDLVVIEEQIPETFGGKYVQQEGRTMKMRIDKGSAIIVAVVSTRKGQTSIRVTASHFMAYFAGFLLTALMLTPGLVFLIAGQTLVGGLTILMAPFAGLYLAMMLAQEAKKKGNEFFNFISGLVSSALATISVDTKPVSEINANLEVQNEGTDLRQGT